MLFQTKVHSSHLISGRSSASWLGPQSAFPLAITHNPMDRRNATIKRWRLFYAAWFLRAQLLGVSNYCGLNMPITLCMFLPQDYPLPVCFWLPTPVVSWAGERGQGSLGDCPCAVLSPHLKKGPDSFTTHFTTFTTTTPSTTRVAPTVIAYQPPASSLDNGSGSPHEIFPCGWTPTNWHWVSSALPPLPRSSTWWWCGSVFPDQWGFIPPFSRTKPAKDNAMVPSSGPPPLPVLLTGNLCTQWRDFWLSVSKGMATSIWLTGRDTF